MNRRTTIENKRRVRYERNKHNPRWAWPCGITGHRKSVGISTCCRNSGWGLLDREGWGGTVVPNTTDRPVVDHPNTFVLYSYEEVGNGEGGWGGSYSVRIELDRTEPSMTESELYRLYVAPAALGYAQAPDSGRVRNLGRSCLPTAGLNLERWCNSVRAMRS